MSDDNPPKPKKSFLRKGEGKNSLYKHNKEKKPFLKKGEGKLACFANENDKTSQNRINHILLEKSKAEIEMILEKRKNEALLSNYTKSKPDFTVNSTPFIQNIRNKKKKNNFLDTIEQRIQNLEDLHKDKYIYTF